MDKKMVLSVMGGIAAFGAAVWAVKKYGDKVPVVGDAVQKAVDVVSG